MSKEKREKLISFIKESAHEFGIALDIDFATCTDEELEKEADWMDYLWTK